MDLTKINQHGAFQVTYWITDPEQVTFEAYDTLASAQARYDFLSAGTDTKSVSLCLTLQSTDYTAVSLVPAGKVFLFRDLSGRGITNELDEAHIRTKWLMDAEDNDNCMTLAHYLDSCEVGDEWTGDQDSLTRIK